tara:strand:- start:1343 stop:2269 length:927 start_codon:yes stop_codon:yes gene_type:complete
MTGSGLQEYHVEADVDGVALDRRAFEGKDIWTLPGNCRADRDRFYLPRGIDWYHDHVIPGMLDAGLIGDGSGGHWDDMKIRYDRTEIAPRGVENRMHIYLGHDTFLGATEKGDRSEEVAGELFSRGVRDFDNPGAYFARCPGVTVLAITRDKKVVVGKRKKEPSLPMFDGLMQGATGYLNYDRNVRNVNLDDEFRRFLKREYGVNQDQIVGDITPLGLYSFEKDASGKFIGRDDLDWGAVAHLTSSSGDFISGQALADASNPGHDELYTLDFDQVQELVSTGRFDGQKWDVVFSTRGPLAALVAEDFQ